MVAEEHDAVLGVQLECQLGRSPAGVLEAEAAQTPQQAAGLGPGHGQLERVGPAAAGIAVQAVGEDRPGEDDRVGRDGLHVGPDAVELGDQTLPQCPVLDGAPAHPGGQLVRELLDQSEREGRLVHSGNDPLAVQEAVEAAQVHRAGGQESPGLLDPTTQQGADERSLVRSPEVSVVPHCLAP